MREKSRERFREIVKVFAFYGFGYILENTKKDQKKSPSNLRKAIEELGPTFIKIGQIVSTRSDILPEEYIKELVKLQDSVPIEKYGVLEKVFEESTNMKMEECFSYYNTTPLASASISQVHEAKLLDGSDVVVKIQRPDIYEKMKMDIAILKRIVKLTKTRININVVNPLEVLEEIQQITEDELDFIKEGNNILRFKENNKEIVPVYVPKLITDIWSDKVLVLEKISGIKITDLVALLEEGYDNKDVAKKLALCYCNQIFDHGFFHADPHPGNLLLADSKICFIDFGIMGELDGSLREWLNSAMVALATKDKSKVVDCILAIGIKAGRIDRGSLYGDISYVVDTYLTTSLKNIKINVLIQEIFNITKKNNIQMPRELVILIRGLMILEGVVAEIDPEIDIISVVISYVKSKNKFLLLNDLNKEELFLSGYEFMRDVSRIPTKSLEVLNKLYNGKAEMKINVKNIDIILAKIDNMINKLTGGLIISSLLIASSLLVASKVKPCYSGISIIGIVGYGIATIFAIILLYNMLKSAMFRTKDKNK